MARTSTVLIFLSLSFLFAGCATPYANDNGLTLMNEDEVHQTIEQYTGHQQVYDGLYNAIDMTVTMRNTKVLQAQLAQRARQAQWDRNKFQAESALADKKAKGELEVFLSFYTPDRKNDDLHKAKTAWHIYLEADGKRWEGSVIKLKLTLAELKALYPEHNPFGSPYLITFPVAVETIENKSSKFTITGPLGAGIVTFDPSGASPR